ncbi:hypothetical protein HPB52_008750 [Rhipicephalus sanguineus]|uniref:Uncharacterized protein n=1 Tax=Rhipicephalus sanguineus TaxID=34632 RepID=A0A9D4SQI7_RHISA|nr:hypothetical protein HPB52_008750 [Rhipicephalus sanguineus]
MGGPPLPTAVGRRRLFGGRTARVPEPPSAAAPTRASAKRSFSDADLTRERPQKRGKTDLEPEEENIKCYVVLEPLESSLGRLSFRLCALSGSTSKSTQWALVFSFPGRALKLDVVCDDDECLLSRVQRVTANYIDEAKEKVPVGRFFLTEEHLYQLEEMGHLGPYDVRQNNCQTFVLSVCFGFSYISRESSLPSAKVSSGTSTA